jgi:hypothetical protein
MMQNMSEPFTADELHKLLHYDPATGVFTWRVSRGHLKAGRVAGSIHSVQGYVFIEVGDRLHRHRYPAHRLAWFYVHGRWPKNQIDHVNRNRADNRISNLRECSNGQNEANSAAAKGRLLKGSYRHRRKWQAKIKFGGKLHYLGTFENHQDAAMSYSYDIRGVARNNA